MNMEKVFQKFVDSVLVLNTQAEIFRYDRWDKIFFIRAKHPSQPQKLFLAFIECESIQFRMQTLHTSLFKFKQAGDYFLLEDISEGLRLKFRSAELWSSEAFYEYDTRLSQQLDYQERYGTRKVITSLTEM
jgi:hypothetical protein